MRVTVLLHSILQIETPEGIINHLEVDMPPGSTIESLLHQLQIKLSPEHLLLARNGRVVDVDQPLQEGDLVNLMPAMSGG